MDNEYEYNPDLMSSSTYIKQINLLTAIVYCLESKWINSSTFTISTDKTFLFIHTKSIVYTLV